MHCADAPGAAASRATKQCPGGANRLPRGANFALAG